MYPFGHKSLEACLDGAFCHLPTGVEEEQLLPAILQACMHRAVMLCCICLCMSPSAVFLNFLQDTVVIPHPALFLIKGHYHSVHNKDRYKGHLPT